MIKWHALITHLFNEDGHRYEYHLCFRDAVRELDLPYVGYINCDCPIPNLPDDWERCLHWREASNPLGKWLQFFSNFFDFSTIFLKKSGESRLFFLESYCIRDVAALTLSISLFFKKGDRFFFLLRACLDANYLHPVKKKVYLFCLRSIRRKLGERFIILADSMKVADYFESTLGKKVPVMPIPHTAGLQKGCIKQPGKKIKLWWAGCPKNEKGIKELHCLCKWESREEFVLYLSEEMPVEANIPVIYLPSILSRQEYVKQLKKVNALLMPYDPISYYSRTSGIFIEAIFAGKVPFVKEGSWLADELRKHDLAELIIAWDSLDEIARLARDQKVLGKLRKMQKYYQKYHSLENYTRVLSGITQSALLKQQK